MIQFRFPVEAWKARSQAKTYLAVSLTGRTEGVRFDITPGHCKNKLQLM